MKRFCLAFEIAGVVLLVLFLAALCIPSTHNPRDKEHETQCKKSLHEIQLAVERYAVDTEGTYPEYLIGGDASDPLISGGYLVSYPRNPFCRNGQAILKFQGDVGDPLRPDAEGAKLGSRFGKDGTLMGNVMPDHRYGFKYHKDKNGNRVKTPTYADFTGYPFYDVWQGNRPRLYLPGEFFYKSNGPVVADSQNPTDASDPFRPVESDQYIMGVYGSIRNKGLDVLGPVPKMAAYTAAAYKAGGDESTKQIEIPGYASLAWIIGKDEFGSEENPGCPFSFGTAPLSKGNPNGIRDGIILVLASGEEVERKT